MTMQSRWLIMMAGAALLGGCGAAGRPASEPCPDRFAGDRVNEMRREIDQLSGRYEVLRTENAAIERLLGELGFSTDMSGATVKERLDLMRRFEQAEVTRTASFQKLRGLLATLAAEHKIEASVEVRDGQLVMRFAERALFEHGRFRMAAAPLVWAIADVLKDLEGRRFEIVAEVGVGAEPAAAKGRRPRAKKGSPDAWAMAQARATEVLRLLEAAGIADDRLAAGARPPEQPKGPRVLDIVVLPTPAELPRIHGIEPIPGPAPTRPARAAAPEKPAKAAASERPAKAAAPEKPVKAAAPEKPVKAAAPEKPVKAAAPEKPAKAAAPEKPARAAAPSKLLKAAAPEKPVKAAAPQKPVKAAVPEKPAKAAAPEKPVKAAAPEKPPKTAAPEKPPTAAAPEKPLKGAAPKKPAKAAAPEKPAKRATPEKPPEAAAPEKPPKR